MEKIVWTSDFSVSDERMDSQHQMLVKMINELIDNEDAGVRSEFVSVLLSKMTDYALEHLRCEEKLLEEVKYPQLDDHKKLHKEYRLTIAKFCTVTASGKVEVTPALLSYLSSWWTDHILVEDKKYSHYITAKS